jgi:hypothetical protein
MAMFCIVGSSANFFKNSSFWLLLPCAADHAATTSTGAFFILRLMLAYMARRFFPARSLALLLCCIALVAVDGLMCVLPSCKISSAHSIVKSKCCEADASVQSVHTRFQTFALVIFLIAAIWSALMPFTWVACHSLRKTNTMAH